MHKRSDLPKEVVGLQQEMVREMAELLKKRGKDLDSFNLREFLPAISEEDVRLKRELEDRRRRVDNLELQSDSALQEERRRLRALEEKARKRGIKVE